MKTITISDKAAEMIEDIRKNNGDNESYMCEAMSSIINMINDNISSTTIDYDKFYPLVVLSEFRELRNAFLEEDDFKTD